MVQVLIDNEYGFRHFVWDFKGTVADVIRWWQGLKEEDDFFFRPEFSLYRVNRRPVIGLEYMNFVRLARKPRPAKLRARGNNVVRVHMHETDDSYLTFRGKMYYPGSRFVW
ncbi:TPA: hypothetical protein DF272_04960 [Candidatus Falkowbacteria bacterium]|nr:hypothetical protein [Candidatus Falkowbacteria bacterium]